MTRKSIRKTDKYCPSNENLTSSLIIYPKKVVAKRSLMSLIMKGSSRAKALLPNTILNQALTNKEEKLFKSLLSRDAKEQKYTVKKKISSGGMGNILYIYDKDLQRHSILKVILGKHRSNATMIKDFVKEARITGQLEHPNIIPVHDLGYLPGYGIYFTMNYIKGDSLLDIIQKISKENNRASTEYDYFTLLNIFRKVCDAAAFAHSKNIIHRDIKPANIMVGKYGEVLLMDWGLAKTTPRKSPKNAAFTESRVGCAFDGTEALKTTRFGVIKGTPAYMPPEQAIGDTSGIDRYSDIFLLGATLYHMFTFQPPYRGNDVMEILRKSQQGTFVAPEKVCSRNPYLSKELCRIINKAMSWEKCNRYASVKEMSEDLDDLLRGKMDFDRQIFREGEFLVKEGESGHNSYIILSGKVEVYKDIKGGKTILGNLKAGDIVGEMALITDELRTASAVALTELEVLVLTKDMFTHNLKKLPSWMEKTISALADRLSVANEKLTGNLS